MVAPVNPLAAAARLKNGVEEEEAEDPYLQLTQRSWTSAGNASRESLAGCTALTAREL